MLTYLELKFTDEVTRYMYLHFIKFAPKIDEQPFLFKARGGGGREVKKFDFLILCLWSTLVEADLVKPKLATKEIALTQKMRFTFFIEI